MVCKGPTGNKSDSDFLYQEIFILLPFLNIRLHFYGYVCIGTPTEKWYCCAWHLENWQKKFVWFFSKINTGFLIYFLKKKNRSQICLPHTELSIPDILKNLRWPFVIMC